MQLGAILMDQVVFSVELLRAEMEVLPGVPWGVMKTFSIPAYWAYQIYARQLTDDRIKYRLDAMLKEEAGTCLLGGYGIPTDVGIAVFYHLRECDVFGEKPPTEEVLIEWLLEPIMIGGRRVRYQFVKQKVRCLNTTLQRFTAEQPLLSSRRESRNWLLDILGIGYKTAPWIARNWLDTDDVTVLDIHILRAGLLGKFSEGNLAAKRSYLELEEQFIRFNKGFGTKASEFNALTWLKMMSSPSTMHNIMGMGHRNSDSVIRDQIKKRKTNSDQLALIG